jgi:hypothetical protein
VELPPPLHKKAALEKKHKTRAHPPFLSISTSALKHCAGKHL